jgi:DNA-directed RNA polymerase subunit beta
LSALGWKTWWPAIGRRPAPRADGRGDQVDATRIVIRATEETDPTRPGVDIIAWRNSSVRTRTPASITSAGSRYCQKGDIVADGPSTQLGELALGRMCSSRSCRGMANFEDRILSERTCAMTSSLDSYRGIRDDGARPSSARGKSLAISNVGEEALKNLDKPAPSRSAK